MSDAIPMEKAIKCIDEFLSIDGHGCRDGVFHRLRQKADQAARLVFEFSKKERSDKDQMLRAIGMLAKDPAQREELMRKLFPKLLS